MLNLTRCLNRFKKGSLAGNLGITFIEMALSKGLNFLIILILTRSLGPESYGKYSLIFATIALCSALFDFGMENTAVRFSIREKEKSQSVFGLYLIIKLSILCGLVLFFVSSGPWLLELINKSETTPYIPYLIIGLIGESLFFVNDTYLQSRQHFRLRGILNISRYGTALGYIIILISRDLMILEYVFYIYWIPVIFSLIFLPTYIRFIYNFFKIKLDIPLLKEMGGYEQWMYVYSIANNLVGRVDFLMLTLWVGFEQLGIFNAAYQLAAIAAIMPLALSKVLLPTLAEKKPLDIFKTTQKINRTIMLIIRIGVLAIPLAWVVTPWLLGPEYTESIPILQLLLLGILANLATMPYEQALYGLEQPRVLSIARYVQLSGIILLNILLIPLLGIVGAAINTLIGRLLYFFFVKRWYKNYEAGQYMQIKGRLKMEPG